MVQTALLALDDSLDEQELDSFFCSPISCPFVQGVVQDIVMILRKFYFLWATCHEAIGGLAVSIPFPKGVATCQFLSGQRRFSDPVAGAYK